MHLPAASTPVLVLESISAEAETNDKLLCSSIIAYLLYVHVVEALSTIYLERLTLSAVHWPRSHLSPPVTESTHQPLLLITVSELLVR